MGKSHNWWWDSHISPKNSKWLEDSLQDMDGKVKEMLMLIEEDADSFAKRAEMFYQKRPQLVSLVEGFYRSYRSLAERYDQLTGELRDNMPAARTTDSPYGKRLTFKKNKSKKQTSDDEGGSERRKKKKEHSDSSSSSSSSDSDSDIEHKVLFNLREENSVLRQKLENADMEKKAEDMKELERKEQDMQKLEGEVAKLTSENKGLIDELRKANEGEMETDSAVRDEALAAKSLSLHEMIKELQQECSKLQSENHGANERVKSLESAVEKLEGERGLSSDISKKLKELRVLEEEMSKITKEKTELHEKHSSLEGQISSHLSENRELRDLHVSMSSDHQSKLAEKDAEVLKLRDELSAASKNISGFQEKISSLEQQKAEVEAEIASLLDRIKSQEGVIAASNLRGEEKEEALNKVHQKIIELVKRRQLHHSLNSEEDVGVWIQRLDEGFSNMDTERSESQRQVGVHVEELGSLEKRLTELQKEKTLVDGKLQDECQRSKGFETDCQRKQEELTGVQLKVKELTSEYEKKAAEVVSLEERISKLTETHTSLQSTHASLQVEHSEAKKGLEKELSELQRSKEAMDAEGKAAIKKLEEDLAALTGQHRSLEETKDALSITVKNKEEERSCLEKEKLDLDGKLTSHLREIEELRKTEKHLQEQLSVHSTRVSGLEAELSTSQADKKKLESETEQERQKLLAELAAARDKHTELTSVHQRGVDEALVLTAAHNSLQEKHRDLGGKLSAEVELKQKFESEKGQLAAEFERKSQELLETKAVLQGKIDEHQTAAASKAKELDKLKEQVALLEENLKKTNEEGQKQIHLMTGESEKLASNLQELQESLKTSKDELVSLKGTLETHQSTKTALEESVQKMQAEISRLGEFEVLVSQMKAENAELTSNLTSLRGVLSTMTEKESELSSQLTALQKQLLDVRGEKTALENSHQRSVEEAATLQGSIQALHKKVEELQSENEKSSKQLAELDKVKEQVSSELAKTKTELEQRLREKEILEGEVKERTKELEHLKLLQEETQALLHEKTELHNSRELELTSFKTTRHEETFSLYKYLFGGDDHSEEREVSHEELERKVLELKSKYLELQEREVSLKDDILVRDSRIQQLEHEVKKLTTERDSAHAEYQKNLERTSAVEKQVDSLTKELLTLKETRSKEVLKLISLLSSGSADAEQEITLDNVERKVTELLKKFAEVKEQEERQRARIQEVEEELRKLKQERDAEHQRTVEADAQNEQKVQKLESRIRELEKISENLAQKCQKLTEEHDKELGSMKNTRSKELLKLLSVFGIQSSATEATHDEVEKKVAELQKSHTEVKERELLLQSDVSEKVTRLRELELETSGLKKAREEADAQHAKERTEYRQKIEELERVIPELEAKVEKLVKECEQTISAHTSLEERRSKEMSKLLAVFSSEKSEAVSYEDVEKKVVELQTVHSETKQRELSLQSEVAEKIARLRELEAEVCGLRQEKDTAAEMSAKEKTELRQKTEELELGISELKAKLEKLAGEYAQMSTEHTSLKERRSREMFKLLAVFSSDAEKQVAYEDVEKKVLELQTSHSETKQRELSLHGEVSEKTTRLRELEAEISSLRQEKDTAQKAAETNAEEHRRRTEALEQVVRDLEAKVEKLAGECERMSTEHTSLKERRSKEMLKLLTVFSSDEAVHAEEREVACEDVEKKVLELQKSHSRTKEREFSLQGELSEKTARFQELESELRRIKQEKDAAQAEHQSAAERDGKRISEYRQKTGGLEQVIAELEAKLQKLSGEFQQMSSDHASLKERRGKEMLKLLAVFTSDPAQGEEVLFEDVEKKVLELKTSHSDTEQREISLQSEVSQNIARLQKLESEICKLKQEKDAAYEEQKKAAETSLKEKTEYQKRIQELENKIRELELEAEKSKADRQMMAEAHGKDLAALKEASVKHILKVLGLFTPGKEGNGEREACYEDVEKKVAELQTSHFESKERELHLQGEVSERSSRVKELEEAVCRLKQEKDSLDSEYQSTLEVAARTKNEQEQKVGQMEKLIRELEVKAAQLAEESQKTRDAHSGELASIKETRSREMVKLLSICSSGVENGESLTQEVLEKSFQELKDREQDLQTELTQKSAQCRELEEKILKAQQEKEALLAEYEKRVKTESEKSRDYEQKIVQLERTVHEADEKRQQITAENDKRSQEHHRELASVKETRSREIFKLFSFFGIGEKSGEEASYDAVERSLSELQTDHSELRNREEQLRTELSEKKTRLLETEEELQKLKQEKAALSEEYKRSQETEARKSREYEQKIEKLEAEIREHEAANQKLNGEHQKLSEELTCLRKEKDVLQQDMDSEVQKLESEKSGFKTKVSEFEKEVETLQSENKSLGDKLAVEVETMQKKVEALEGENRTLLEESHKVRGLQQELSSVQEENRMLKFEISKRDILVQRLEGDFSKLREEKADVGEQLRAASEQLRRMQGELVELQEEDKRLKSKLESMSEKVQSLEGRVSQLEQENRKLVEEAEASVTENKTLVAVLRFLRAEMASIIQKTRSLSKEVADSEKSLKVKDEKLVKLQAEMKAVESEQQRFASLNRELSKKVEDLEVENKSQQWEMEMRSEEKRAAIRQLCFSLNCMREENKRLEESVKTRNRRIRTQHQSNSVSGWKSFWNPWYNNNNNGRTTPPLPAAASTSA